MAPCMFFYAECDDHCLVMSKSPSRVSCFMCEKPLGFSADIFMYRGNTPFCTMECRQEQIEMDDAEERRKRKRAALRSKAETGRSAAGSRSGRIQFKWLDGKGSSFVEENHQYVNERWR